jgi:hypothetical protein
MRHDSLEEALGAAKADFEAQEQRDQRIKDVLYNDLVFKAEFAGDPIIRRECYIGHPKYNQLTHVHGYWGGPHDAQPVVMWGSRLNLTQVNGTPSGRAKDIIARWLKRRKFTSASAHHIRKTIEEMVTHYAKTRYLHGSARTAVNNYFSTYLPGYSVCYLDGERHWVETRSTEWRVMRHMMKLHKQLGDDHESRSNVTDLD